MSLYTHKQRIGFIGLGAMGKPMASHLANNAQLYAVWNRTTVIAEEFSTTHKVVHAANPRILAQDCDVIVLCVSADQDLLQLITDIQPHLRAGALVIDHSSVAPATAKQVAKKLAEHEVKFIDAPVSGGVEGARQGTLSVMVGGTKESVERAKNIIENYSARITAMGPVGNGQATKAVNQVLVAGIAEAVCEGLALAEQLDLPKTELLNVLQSGAAGNWFLDKRGATMLADDCDIGFKLDLLLKDLGILQTLTKQKNLTLSGVNRAIDDYSQCQSAGDGEQDISALIRLKRQQITNE